VHLVFYWVERLVAVKEFQSVVQTVALRGRMTVAKKDKLMVGKLDASLVDAKVDKKG
jgi:hypothetical protein